jgi:hypothetical protein
MNAQKDDPMSEKSIWIAHARADTDAAKKLGDMLDRQLFEVLNGHVPQGAASNPDAFKEFIHRADVVIAVLSLGMDEDEVIPQLREAASASKPRIAAFIADSAAVADGVKGTEIESYLRNCPSEDLSEPDGLRKLLDTIRRVLSFSPSASPMEPPFEAYNGNEPYLFVSYSHKDSSLVYPELARLHWLGFRIWYDEGIDPGNEWPEDVATALDRCSFFLVFITPRAVESQNVRNEINFALNYRKPFLAIHAVETDLPKGLELRMGDRQAVLKYRMNAARYDRQMEKALPAVLRAKPGVPTAGNALWTIPHAQNEVRASALPSPQAAVEPAAAGQERLSGAANERGAGETAASKAEEEPTAREAAPRQARIEQHNHLGLPPSSASSKADRSSGRRATRPLAFIGSAIVLLIVLGYFLLRPAPGAPIHFETTPAGAQVTVDGKSCSTPCDLKLKAGDYSVKASRAGSEPVEEQLSVGNVPKTVALELVGAAPALGSLGIASNVEAADVLVDGALKGVTSGKVTTIKVTPGDHDVRLEKNGFQPASQRVTIQKDSTASLSFTLVPGRAGEQPVRDPYLIVRGQPGARIAVDKNSVGVIQVDGTFSLQTKPGKHRVELSLDGYEPWSATVSAQAGESVPVTAAMKAIPKPPASVGEFTASAGSIQAGQATELRWQTQNASDVSIEPGVGSVSASGTQRVTPGATTTYVLTARGNGAPAQSSVTISVVALPRPSIALFTAGSDRLEAGQETKLSWATQNANEVAIEGIGNVEANASRVVRPARSTTYVLTAKGPGGSVTQSVQINVVTAATSTAAPENPDIQAVRDAIEQRYRDAYESMVIGEMVRVWPTMTKPQQDAINGTFRMYRAIKARYSCAQPAISGDTARCTCIESVTYTTVDIKRQPPVNERQPPVSVSVVFELKKSGGTWYVQNRHGQ